MASQSKQVVFHKYLVLLRLVLGIWNFNSKIKEKQVIPDYHMFIWFSEMRTVIDYSN